MELHVGGTESIWDYPVRPAIRLSGRHVVVAFGGVEIAASRRARRVIEYGRPPVYYLPRCDVRMDLLRMVRYRTWCVFRGVARYYDLVVGDHVSRLAAWSYLHPVPAMLQIQGCVAFYPDRVDSCYLAGERVRAKPGSFFGGWITDELLGPFDIEPPSEDVEI